MSIAPGSPSSSRGRRPQQSDSQEARYLYEIIQALKNNGGIENSILDALGGSNLYNLPAQYLLGDTDTQSFATDSVHALSFQVLSGSVDVSMDGDPAITYPTGSIINMEFSTTNEVSIDFDVTTGSVLIQTIA